MTRLLLLLLAAVVQTGCNLTGSTKQAPAKTLSHSRFVYLAHRAARRFVCAVEPRGKVTTFAQARANLHKGTAALERMIVTLRGLKPPASDAIPLGRTLAAFDQIDVLLHRLADAADARELQRIKTLVKQMHRAIARFDRRFHVHHHRGEHHVCTKR